MLPISLCLQLLIMLSWVAAFQYDACTRPSATSAIVVNLILCSILLYTASMRSLVAAAATLSLVRTGISLSSGWSFLVTRLAASGLAQSWNENVPSITCPAIDSDGFIHGWALGIFWMVPVHALVACLYGMGALCGEERPTACGLSRRSLLAGAMWHASAVVNMLGPYRPYLAVSGHIVLVEIALIEAAFFVWLGCTLWLMHRMAPYHRALFLTALHTADAAAIFGPTDIREVCGDDATCHDEATPAEPPH